MVEYVVVVPIRGHVTDFRFNDADYRLHGSDELEHFRCTILIVFFLEIFEAFYSATMAIFTHSLGNHKVFCVFTFNPKCSSFGHIFTFDRLFTTFCDHFSFELFSIIIVAHQRSEWQNRKYHKNASLNVFNQYHRQTNRLTQLIELTGERKAKLMRTTHDHRPKWTEERRIKNGTEN